MRKIHTMASFLHLEKSRDCAHHQDQASAMIAAFTKAMKSRSITILYFRNLLHGEKIAPKRFSECPAHLANIRFLEFKQQWNFINASCGTVSFYPEMSAPHFWKVTF